MAAIVDIGAGSLRLVFGGGTALCRAHRLVRVGRRSGPFCGGVGFGPKPRAESLRIADAISPPELLRPLFEYERLVGGRW